MSELAEQLRLAAHNEEMTGPDSWAALLTQAADKIERLQTIVKCCAAECEPDDSLEVNERVALLRAKLDKQPKTVDGVVVIPYVDEEGGTELFRCAPAKWGGGLIVGGCDMPSGPWYSTPEAAQAAKESQ